MFLIRPSFKTRWTTCRINTKILGRVGVQNSQPVTRLTSCDTLQALLGGGGFWWPSKPITQPSGRVLFHDSAWKRPNGFDLSHGIRHLPAIRQTWLDPNGQFLRTKTPCQISDSNLGITSPRDGFFFFYDQSLATSHDNRFTSQKNTPICTQPPVS